jgi:hypothetical protein
MKKQPKPYIQPVVPIEEITRILEQYRPAMQGELYKAGIPLSQFEDALQSCRIYVWQKYDQKPATTPEPSWVIGSIRLMVRKFKQNWLTYCDRIELRPCFEEGCEI